MALMSSAGARERIRLATLAPKGTSFHQILLEMGAEWAQAPDGGAQLTVFPDGTMGSEADMVRRMRLGQLQAALITATGLSQIEPATSVLQNMPFTYHSLEEAAKVRAKIEPELEKRLEQKGFLLLGWTDGGWVRFFSKSPAATPDEFRKLRLFTWAGDRETQSVARDLGFQIVPLEPSDILTSLSTGMIDIVPSPPFFALAGQVFTAAPYMLDVNYAPIVGGIVVSKRAWDKLSPAAQAALRASAARAGARITERAHVEMEEAIQAMKARGLTIVSPDATQRAEWEALALDARNRIRKVSADPQLYDLALQALEDFRQTD